ncbi:hypothetical protein BJ546DRAFT_116750 [Cryomyces antarcticus]
MAPGMPPAGAKYSAPPAMTPTIHRVVSLHRDAPRGLATPFLAGLPHFSSPQFCATQHGDKTSLVGGYSHAVAAPGHDDFETDCLLDASAPMVTKSRIPRALVALRLPPSPTAPHKPRASLPCPALPSVSVSVSVAIDSFGPPNPSTQTPFIGGECGNEKRRPASSCRSEIGAARTQRTHARTVRGAAAPSPPVADEEHARCGRDPARSLADSLTHSLALRVLGMCITSALNPLPDRCSSSRVRAMCAMGGRRGPITPPPQAWCGETSENKGYQGKAQARGRRREEGEKSSKANRRTRRGRNGRGRRLQRRLPHRPSIR